MAVVATLLVRVAANLTELDKTFSELERSADRIAKSYAKLGGQLQGIGSKLTTGLTLPIAALGIAAGKSAMDFDTALRGVQAAIQPTTAEMEQLRSAAVEWGQKTKFSATEAAQALGELGKAGVKSTDAVALLPSVLNLATVGEMDLAEAAATTTDTLGQFNLEVKDAGRVNDVLAAGAQASTTSVKELRNALVQVGSVAGNFGMTIEETTGALAAFANIGLKGEKAGTALKNVVTSIVNPMKGMKDVFLELNIGTLASADGTVHLTEVVKKLGDAGASESQIVRAFGEVAGPGMVGLVGKGTQSLVDMTTAMQNSGGTADRVAKTLLSGLGGAWEAMTGAVETASIALGTILAPALEMAAGLVSDLAEFVSGTLVPAFESLPSPLKIIAGGFVGLLAAVGPLVYVAGTLAQSWSGLVGLFAKSAGGAASAADAAKGLTTALTTQAGAAKLAAFWTGALEVVTSILVSPITAVVVAVGALVIGLRVLTGSWEGVLRVLTAGLVDFETLGRLWEGLKTVGAGVSDGFTILQSSIRDAVRTIKTEFTPAVDAMRRLVTDVGGAIRAPLAAAVRELGGATKDAASGGMDDLVQKLYDIGRAMAIESVLAQLRGQLLVVTETFRQLSIWIGNTVDSIKTLLIGAINSATGAIQIFYLQAKQLASVFGVDLPGAIQKTSSWLRTIGIDVGGTGTAASGAWSKWAAGIPTLSDIALRAKLGAEGFAALKRSQEETSESFRNFVPGVSRVSTTLEIAGLAATVFGDGMGRLALGGGPVVRTLEEQARAATLSADAIREKAAADKKAAEEAKKAREEFQKLVDQMSGASVIAKARELTNVYAALTAQGLKPSAAGARELTDAISAAADVVHRKGGQLADDMVEAYQAFQPERGVLDGLIDLTRDIDRVLRGWVPTVKQNLKPMQAALLAAFQIPDPNIGKQVEKYLRASEVKAVVDQWGAQLKTQIGGILGGMFTGQTGFRDGFASMLGSVRSFANDALSEFGRELSDQFGNMFAGGSFDFGELFGGDQKAKGAAVGAAVGMTVGIAFGSAFGKEVGALVGAGAGAATGALIGGWVGAGVGAGVGFISGLMAGIQQEAQQRAAMKQAKADLISTFGSVEDLAQAARSAGVDFDQLWNTQDPKHFQGVLQILQVEMAKSKKLVEEMASALDKTTASGQLLSKLDLSNLALQSGRLPTADARTKAKGPAPGSEEAAFAFIGAQQTAALAGIDTFLTNAKIKTDAGAMAISASLAGIYQTLIESGATPTQAFAQMEPVIAKLQAQLTATGKKASEAFLPLGQLAAMAATAVGGPVMDAMAGLEQGLTSTANLGLLNQETFGGFAAEMLAGFKQLEALGMGGETALAGMQGGLQKLWELSTDFGYTLGPNEQAMLDFAIASGTVGDKFRPAADRMANAIDALVDRMDKFLMKFEDLVPAANDATRGVEDAFGRMRIPPVEVPFVPRWEEGYTPGGSTTTPGAPGTMAIPALARGAIVSRPTVALIGESGPEAVVPLSKDFGSSTDVTLMLDSEVLTRAVLRKQPRIMRAYGVAR